MHVNIIKTPSDLDWIIARRNGRTTMGLPENPNIVSSQEKQKMFLSEHSPIRSLAYVWEWVGLPYWVSVHFTRHKIGIEHWVRSQRNDRQKSYDRNSAPQNALVAHGCTANAQAIINISKVRLCTQASTETAKAWMMLIQQLSMYEPELINLCVPSCVYRNGICPEVYGGCKYRETSHFVDVVSKYRKLFK